MVGRRKRLPHKNASPCAPTWTDAFVCQPDDLSDLFMASGSTWAALAQPCQRTPHGFEMAIVAGGEFAGLGDDAIVEREEEFHDFGIAPTTLGFFLHDAESFVGRKGRFVRPGLRERVVDVDGLQYAGQQGGLLD